jgi:hypothetical protein
LTWTAVVDAWVEELTTSVQGLADVVVHRYASWSVEALVAERGERHLAIWPEAEGEAAEGYLSDGSLLSTQRFVVLVWEDSSTEQGRLQDNESADAAWLDLHEQIRARFLKGSNVRLGSTSLMDTRYRESAFDRVGLVRTMALRFTVRVPLSVT